MKIFVLILCVFFTTSKAFAQEQVKTTYNKNGKTYTIYHRYHLFKMSYLMEEQKTMTTSVGYWDKTNKNPTLAEIVGMTNHPSNGYVFTCTHYLALTNRKFEGDEYSGYNVPFVGQCTDAVNYIIIKNKRHKIENNEDIYFRQVLKLNMGYNRVYVDIELKSGVILKGQYLEINIVNINQGYDINIK